MVGLVGQLGPGLALWDLRSWFLETQVSVTHVFELLPCARVNCEDVVAQKVGRC